MLQNPLPREDTGNVGFFRLYFRQCTSPHLPYTIWTRPEILIPQIKHTIVELNFR